MSHRFEDSLQYLVLGGKHSSRQYSNAAGACLSGTASYYMYCAPPSDVLRASIPPVHALDILLSADVIRMALASREAGWASEAAV